ncbi:MFS transporter [Paratractidigestivibacter sp.]|uniref:MFS transporter n=1 Tax=Paratractidigestivibacter sp. TaxID=2847316 RepID=UPI002AC9792A|nr:MFS transporter [Paratractidigestivibacter sp.]
MDAGMGSAGKHDVAIILAASFFYLASPMLVNPLVTGFAGELGASAVLMGLIGGVTNLASLFVRPVAGNLVDRLPKRRMALGGSLLMAASCLGYAAAWAPAVLVAFRVANGVGYSLCSVAMSSWLASLLPRDRVGAGMGLFGMMNALGMAVGPSLGLAVQGTLGYRAAFVCAGFLAAVCFVLAALVPDLGAPSATPSERRGYRLVAPSVVPVALIVMLFTLPYTATQSFIVSYVAGRAPATTVGLFFPVYAAALLALRFGLRRALDTVSIGRFLAAGSACALASFALLWRVQDNAALVAAAVCTAGGYGLMCSVCQTAAVKLAAPGDVGLANSTYYMGFDLGMSLGPIVGGAVIATGGLGSLYPCMMVTVPLAAAVYLHFCTKK